MSNTMAQADHILESLSRDDLVTMILHPPCEDPHLPFDLYDKASEMLPTFDANNHDDLRGILGKTSASTI